MFKQVLLFSPTLLPASPRQAPKQFAKERTALCPAPGRENGKNWPLGERAPVHTAGHRAEVVGHHYASAAG